ncbi:putative inhibitor of apoptosis [Rhopalosiphum maidis]|uniref:putative inhibitor of apoptosis n=1 Tax=Rhopalosiphum maidis TaxID=43146 RepID=UPI000EFFA197|nr:putative inhibitor of apoptosis [Rhopalosiphum maidis]
MVLSVSKRYVVDILQSGFVRHHQHTRLFFNTILFVRRRRLCAPKYKTAVAVYKMSEDLFKTFDERWTLTFISPFEMAIANFRYTGVGDQVTCHFCKKLFFDWQPGDNPLREHIRLSQKCPYVVYAMKLIKGRLLTFSNWSVEFLNPYGMAQAGYFYTGVQDRVKCLLCMTEFGNWQQHDFPFDKHAFQSPQCPYVIENRNFFIKTALSRPTIELKNINDRLHFEGIIIFLKPLFHEKMIEFDKRLDSFKRCLIPLQHDINTLCEAGYFYSGNGYSDTMTCFYCNDTRGEWTENEEPWVVHAKRSKNCSYLLLKKGKSFSNMVHAVKRDIIKSNQLELFKLIAAKNNTLTIGKNMKIQSTKKHINRIRITKLSSNKIQEHCFQMLDPNILPDSMICKICYKEEIQVAVIPCGHTISCIQCSITFIRCAVCRDLSFRLMRVYLCKDIKRYKYLKSVPSSAKMSSNNTMNTMLCKVCHKEGMTTVFLPCRHVYSCGKCAEQIDKCLICREDVFSLVKLYF